MVEYKSTVITSMRRRGTKRVRDSKTELCSSPHSPLGVVADGVAGFHSYPLWDGAVLSLLLGQDSLDFEGLVSRHYIHAGRTLRVSTRLEGGVLICACVRCSKLSALTR